MFEASSGKVENIFEILLGKKKLKWDPFWNFLHWLCIPNQGHGLGEAFQQRLNQFAFGKPTPEMSITQEFRVDPHTPGSGKWADLALSAPGSAPPYSHLILMDDVDCTRPNESRKINNLVDYSEQGRALVEKGTLRVLVLTNTTDTSKFEKLRKALGPEYEGYAGEFAWRILSLPTLGSWVKDLSVNTSTAGKVALESFITWSSSM